MNWDRRLVLHDITGDQNVVATIQTSIRTFLESLPGNPMGAKLIDFYSEPHLWVPEAKKWLARGEEQIQGICNTDKSFVCQESRTLVRTW
jgi:hypothetical protein